MPDVDLATVEADMRRVAQAIRTRRFRFGDEKELQEAIGFALDLDAVDHRREHRVGASGILDFYLPMTGVAVEVKVGGSFADAALQVGRYLADERVTGLVLATTRARLIDLPPVLHGKPILVVSIAGALS